MEAKRIAAVKAGEENVAAANAALEEEKVHDLPLHVLKVAGDGPDEGPPVRSLCALKAPYKDYQRMSILVDSGAAEHVLPRSRLPTYPVVEGAAKKAGVRYSAADGTEIPNEGEQSVRFATREGHECGILFQVADITQPLLSVAKLAAKGHDVTFNGDTGRITHLESGKSIRFYRQGGVYMLHVWVRPGPLTSFRGLGARSP